MGNNRINYSREVIYFNDNLKQLGSLYVVLKN